MNSKAKALIAHQAGKGPACVDEELPQEVLFQPFAKQMHFIEMCLIGGCDKLLYGGAIRGGKSFVAIAILLLLCKLFPGSRHVIIRRDFPTIRRNVLPVFNKLAPKKFIKNFSKSEYECQFTNGSSIIFMSESIKDDPELYRFRGLEFNSAVLEEMNELQEKTFWKMHERKGTWIIPNTTPGKHKCPNILIGTCNPAQNWVKRMFYDPWAQKHLAKPWYYCPASIDDNPHPDEEFRKALLDLPPEVYNVFVKGSWEGVDNVNQLVPWKSIDDSIPSVISNDHTMALGVDVGRMGNDPTVLIVLEGGNIVRIDEYPKTKIDEAADIVQRRMLEYNIPAEHVCIDSVGLGAGVVDILSRKGLAVIPMSGGMTTITTSNGMQYTLDELLEGSHYKFSNWKAYSYWKTMEVMRDKRIGNFVDETLRSDCGAINYFIKNDKVIHVQDKNTLKTLLGKSPDHWDAFTYAVWAWISNEIFPEVSIYTSAQHRRELEQPSIGI